MKGRTLAILIIICGILAWLAFAPEENAGPNLLLNTEPFKDFDINAVDKLVIEQEEKVLSLEKTEGLWRAKNKELDYMVDYETLRDFMVSIQKMEIIAKKSRSDKRDEKFGLNKESKPMTIKLYSQGKEIQLLSLGKIVYGEPENKNNPYAMPKELGQFIRYDGKNVFESKEKVKVDIKPTFWMPKNIAEAKKEDISKIEYVFPHKQYQLEKQTQAPKEADENKASVIWIAKGDLPEDKSLQQKEMGTLLDRLLQVNLSQPVPLKKLKGLSKKFPYQIKLSSKDKTIYEIHLQEQEETWYVKNLLHPNEIYQIDNWRVEQIFAYSKNLFKLSDHKLSDKSLKAISYEGLGFKANLENGQWLLAGAKPLPKLKGDKVKESAELLNDLDLADFHIRDLQKEDGAKTIFHLEGGESVTIQSVGSIFLQDAKLITISGKKQIYSVSEFTYNKLFPKQSELLELNLKPVPFETLTEIDLSDMSFEKKDGKWFKKGTDVLANLDNLSEFVDSLKIIYKSSYISSPKAFKPMKTVKLKNDKGESLELKFSDGVKGKAFVSSSQYGGTFSTQWDVVRVMLKPAKHFLAAQVSKEVSSEQDEKAN